MLQKKQVHEWSEEETEKAKAASRAIADWQAKQPQCMKELNGEQKYTYGMKKYQLGFWIGWAIGLLSTWLGIFIANHVL